MMYSSHHIGLDCVAFLARPTYHLVSAFKPVIGANILMQGLVLFIISFAQSSFAVPNIVQAHRHEFTEAAWPFFFRESRDLGSSLATACDGRRKAIVAPTAGRDALSQLLVLGAFGAHKIWGKHGFRVPARIRQGCRVAFLR